MNPPPTAREVGQLWFEKVWNGRDPAAAHELMAPEATGYLEAGQQIIGPEQFLEFQRNFLAAVPDIHIRIVECLADETNTCVHWRAAGTHTGDGLGFQPTGARVDFNGITWFRVRDGRIVDGRDFWNIGGLMEVMAGRTPVAE